MYNVLVHGLGQDETSWDEVKKALNDFDFETPSLYKLLKGKKADYINLYAAFKDYLNGFDGKLNLCGLSLGGILALNYAKEYPQKLNSLILIGTPHKIPKFLFMLQGLAFRMVKKEAFEELGTDKKSFIGLVKSMSSLDIMKGAEKVCCPTTLCCGESDKANINSLEPLHAAIKGSVVTLIKDSGHEVNIDNPSGLAELINSLWFAGGK